MRPQQYCDKGTVKLISTFTTRVDPLIQKVIKLQLHILASMKSCNHIYELNGPYYESSMIKFFVDPGMSLCRFKFHKY